MPNYRGYYARTGQTFYLLNAPGYVNNFEYQGEPMQLSLTVDTPYIVREGAVVVDWNHLSLTTRIQTTQVNTPLTSLLNLRQGRTIVTQNRARFYHEGIEYEMENFADGWFFTQWRRDGEAEFHRTVPPFMQDNTRIRNVRDFFAFPEDRHMPRHENARWMREAQERADAQRTEAQRQRTMQAAAQGVERAQVRMEREAQENATLEAAIDHAFGTPGINMESTTVGVGVVFWNAPTRADGRRVSYTLFDDAGIPQEVEREVQVEVPVEPVTIRSGIDGTEVHWLTEPAQPRAYGGYSSYTEEYHRILDMMSGGRLKKTDTAQELPKVEEPVWQPEPDVPLTDKWDF